MPKPSEQFEIDAFSKRLVDLLAHANIGRRGAGSYLASKYKVSGVTANAWLNGTHRPAPPIARRIAEDHGATFEALYFGASLSGHDSTRGELVPAGTVTDAHLDTEEMVYVSRVHGARLAAGSGELVFESEEVDRSHGFRADYMKRRGLNPMRCKLFSVRGESMLPTIPDGGLILVNLADREVESGKVYALVSDDGLRVKRLFKMSGYIEMRSDNPMQHIYPPEPIRDGSAAVIGRVVWQASDL